LCCVVFAGLGSACCPICGGSDGGAKSAKSQGKKLRADASGPGHDGDDLQRSARLVDPELNSGQQSARLRHRDDLQEDEELQLALHAWIADASGPGHDGDDLQRALRESMRKCPHEKDLITPTDVRFSNALSGAPLNLGYLDLSLPVAALRECIADSKSFKDVHLFDSAGHILRDSDILGQLGISEIGVCFARKDRMSVEALHARFLTVNVYNADVTACNGIYALDEPCNECITFRNQDCPVATISWEGHRWTLCMDGSVIYFCDSAEPPCDGFWLDAKRDGTCEVSHTGVLVRGGRLPNDAEGKKRLQKELAVWHAGGGPPGCTAEVADNGACLRIAMPGPDGTAYAGATFELLMGFPADYPYNPSEVWFVTEVEHWSVAPSGKMLMDILNDKWTPALNSMLLITSVQSVLATPQPS
jgi:ubiquitin-protein ligase